MEQTPEPGRYSPIHELGLGGAAHVFAGRVSGVAKPFALKYLNEDLANSPSHRRRFDREAAIGLEVSGTHPNIVTTRSYDPDAVGAPVLVLDLVGPALRVYKERFTGDMRAIRWIAAQALRALEQLERCGVVHGDVSTGNLLIAPSGRVLLTDFGNAMRHGDAREGILGGTIPYASPEMLRGERCDTATDLFSLGAVLFELVTGEPPFGTDVETVALRQLAGPPELPRSVARELRGLILGLLAYEERDRLTLAEALAYLRRVDSSVAVRLGALAQQWLAEVCPTLIKELRFERADRGPALALWVHERRRRPEHVATAAMGAVVAAAAGVGLWMALGSPSKQARQAYAPQASLEVPPTTGVTQADALVEESSADALLLAIDETVPEADEKKASTSRFRRTSGVRDERDIRRIQEALGKIGRAMDASQGEETGKQVRGKNGRSLARAGLQGDVRWEGHPDRLGGGVHYGPARWVGDALVVDVVAEPPFAMSTAFMGDQEGLLRRLENRVVEVVFPGARGAGLRRTVTVFFGEVDGDFAMQVTLEVP